MVIGLISDRRRTRTSSHSGAGNIVRAIAFACMWFFVFTIPWENLIMIPAVGTFSRLVGLLMAVFGALSVIVSGEIRKSWVLTVAVFVAWVWASVAWSLDSEAAFRYSFTLTQLLAFSWMVTQLVRRKDDLDVLLQAYIYGSYLSV